MKKLSSGVFFFLFLFVVFFVKPLLAGQVLHHDILAQIVPEKNEISVIDVVSFGEAAAGFSFILHDGKIPAINNKGASIVKLSNAEFKRAYPEFARSTSTSQTVPVAAYRINLLEKSNKVTLEYTLSIKHEVSNGDSAGIISSEGVYLAGESLWYPRFNDDLVAFRLSVRLPSGWKSVSQGERKYVEDEKTYRLDAWEETKAQDDIYLIAAKFVEYSQMADVGKGENSSVNAMAFLREKDDALAKKYLDATAQYLEMYQRLLGEYPYKKFALVENFWQTGFGMPSFTLLGSRIIRFPFILYSSYPHELLHNWWGNSVYVDYNQGNWAVGLTAYLADHLLKEQRGRGVSHRRSVLQKYTNFTQAGGDFPLNRFVSRYDAVTEAVGYGKTMMMFHMLRLKIGDALFIRGLQTFYLQNRYKVAGYADIESTFSAISGENLKPFFETWITRTGAPDLKLSDVQVLKESDGQYRLMATLRQSQVGKPYELYIPIAIALDGQQQSVQQVIKMTKKTHSLNLQFSAKPVLIEIDPEFDVFRRLGANETPPSVSQVFGAADSVIIISHNETPEMISAYEKMAKSWQRSQSGNIIIGFDSAFDQLPTNKSVWLLGKNNKFKPDMITALKEYPFSASQKGVVIKEAVLNFMGNSMVLVGHNPLNSKHALAYVSVDKVDAASGLARKLPHYGKYSYLGFEGDAPTNSLKGQWPIINSPLSARLSSSAVKTMLIKRQPLITLLP